MSFGESSGRMRPEWVNSDLTAWMLDHNRRRRRRRFFYSELSICLIVSYLRCSVTRRIVLVLVPLMHDEVNYQKLESGMGLCVGSLIQVSHRALQAAFNPTLFPSSV